MPIKSRTLRFYAFRLPVVLALAGLAGCASVTPIGNLVGDPARYNGKTVRIEGDVKGSVGGLGLGAYEVKDNTGTITVVSQKGDPPPTGSKIGVKGKFQALLTLGIKSLAVIREESRFFR